MAQEIINNGTTAGDGTGENLFNSFEKVNNNFTEVYNFTGWQSRVDTVNTQSLKGLTNNLISFTGTLEENGNLSLLDTNSKITPVSLNDFIIVDFAFTAVTPATTNQYLNILFIVNGVVYRAMTHIFLKKSEIDDNVSVSFGLPVTNAFLTNGGEIYINPSTSVEIKDRYIAVNRTHKGK